jgi:hypothetical protein
MLYESEKQETLQSFYRKASVLNLCNHPGVGMIVHIKTEVSAVLAGYLFKETGMTLWNVYVMAALQLRIMFFFWSGKKSVVIKI